MKLSISLFLTLLLTAPMVQGTTETYTLALPKRAPERKAEKVKDPKASPPAVATISEKCSQISCRLDALLKLEEAATSAQQRQLARLRNHLLFEQHQYCHSTYGISQRTEMFGRS